MSIWIHNLRLALNNNLVVLLHGNVRDCYIDDAGRTYAGMGDLLIEVARSIPGAAFQDIVIYDPASRERRIPLRSRKATPSHQAPADEFDDPPAVTNVREGRARAGGADSPQQLLARWKQEVGDGAESRFYVLNYLDKTVPYKPSYSADETETILWLEKMIGAITATHRLVLIALQDTMIPVELYTHNPKCRVLQVQMPEKSDRERYLRHQLGEHEHLSLAANLTAGLYLTQVGHIADAMRGQANLGSREVSAIINRYRMGVEKDYWADLSILDLDAAEQRIGLTDDARQRHDANIERSGGRRVSDRVRSFDPVKGQDDAVKAVVHLLCRARAGLSGIASGSTTKPKGVLFFAGTTGTGKTFLAKRLAQFLFDTEDAFIRIDMSELMEEHSVSKLIGSPPGYVGSDRGGMLTNAVRERPFSVVLFDEIEKAHPKIMDIFLQILDEGRLTDSRGQTVFFTETIVVFTSNVGCRTMDSQGRPLPEERRQLDAIRAEDFAEPDARKERLREHFISAVERFFISELSRPELLNRIGSNIVPFNEIHDPDIQRQIVIAHLGRIKADFEDKYRASRFKLFPDPTAAEHLVAKHGEQMARNGGRGITNAIEEDVVMALARAVLRAEEKRRVDTQFYIEADAGQLRVRSE